MKSSTPNDGVDRREGLTSGSHQPQEIAMLVLSRKLGEKIVIGDNVVITIVKIDRNQIRIGIEAPQDIPVYREEIAPNRAEPAKIQEAVPV
jgi:carbon storage regulator